MTGQLRIPNVLNVSVTPVSAKPLYPTSLASTPRVEQDKNALFLVDTSL